MDFQIISMLSVLVAQLLFLFVAKQWISIHCKVIKKDMQILKGYQEWAHKRQLNSIKQERAKYEGLLSRAIIQSKVSEKMSQRGFDIAHDAMVKVAAFEKSTHRVQYMPIEKVLERNGMAEQEVNKILNPGNEENDWLDEWDEDKDLGVLGHMIKNAKTSGANGV